VKYYDEGKGAEGTWWSKLIDGATGNGIDQSIKVIYEFIIWNYEPGDELYLFGFSRGAYIARSLAGLIRNCGILKNNDLGLIDEAYAIYRDRKNRTYRPDGALSKQFREKYSHPVQRIKFIGAWDTVGELGIPARGFQWYNKRYQFHDTRLSSLVENGYHALAIDEHRNNFKPTLWTKSNKVAAGEVLQVMEQQWFAGSHSNIGGGYPDVGLSDIALEWMIEKAAKHGLGFDETYINTQLRPCFEGRLYNSKTGIFEFLPDHLRTVMKAINAGEKVDDSVFERMRALSGYRPENIINPVSSQLVV
ncbi:MAG: DUF2235 domain-containing protein, partial [Bacteroidetes bacterium]|nr:DUF2235 domain-containing protein [Bacteroidota bacterium]